MSQLFESCHGRVGSTLVGLYDMTVRYLGTDIDFTHHCRVTRDNLVQTLMTKHIAETECIFFMHIMTTFLH